MTLPLLLAVPHAGLTVPDAVSGICLLDCDEVARDGDEGAADIYLPLDGAVQECVTTEIARAVIDMNRAEEDRSRDGIVKTHTCWDVPIYRERLSEQTVCRLIQDYYRPYHARLSRCAGSVIAGIDCHTMAACGPPVGPDPGAERPAVCISNADGTCPQAWLLALQESMAKAFGLKIAVNRPFRGGWTIRRHAREMPWVQVELSRAPFMTSSAKRACFLAALENWCAALHRYSSPGGRTIQASS